MIKMTKLLSVLLILVLPITNCLITKEPFDHLLTTDRMLVVDRNFYYVNQDHIGTFQGFSVSRNSFSSSTIVEFVLNTYTLDGKYLHRCNYTDSIDNNSNTSHKCSLTSLRNNDTEVLMCTEDIWDNPDKFLLRLKVYNTTKCKSINDQFEISKTTLTGLRATDKYVKLFVVPYIDYFDVVFPSGGHYLKVRYGADGFLTKNPMELAVGETNNIVSVNSIVKYDKSKDLLLIYEHGGSQLTAVLANQKGKVLKRKALLNVTEGIYFKYNEHSVFGEVDYGKLVLCDLRTNITRCERYNASTLESETRVELGELMPYARIHLLPDGGFFLLKFKLEEEDTIYFLTKVNADGTIEETIKITTCSVLPMSTYPYIYFRNEKVCLVYMCVGVVPFNQPGKRTSSTHVTCY